MPIESSESTMPSLRRRLLPWLVIAGLVAVLAATAFGVWRAWIGLPGATISGPGLIAMALGAGATVLLGIGLMALVFISSRRGFDDEAGHD